MKGIKLTVSTALLLSFNMVQADRFTYDADINKTDYSDTECATNFLEADKPEPRNESMTFIVNEFKKTDLNKDNRICYDEIVKVHRDSISEWTRYDRDKNGCITPVEAITSFREDLTKMWSKQHSELDADRNGTVEDTDIKWIFRKEMPGTLTPVEILNLYDKDNDKIITKQEYIAQSIVLFRESKKGTKGFSPQ
jgi:Ca2+-binding EF-hand superfamily protein